MPNRADHKHFSVNIPSWKDLLNSCTASLFITASHTVLSHDKDMTIFCKVEKNSSTQ